NLIGIAKGRGRSAAAARHGKSRRVDEHIFVSGRKNPVRLGSHSPAIHLLQRVRDEAHRFAVTYHRRLRAKKAVAGELESIPGIGPSRQAALLRRFGSVARLRTASADEIASLPEIPRGLAERIVAALKPDRVPE
ncbi:MAG: excinuclease ABC subunit C, partial [Candidatus Hydrogenedentes bacterium]|nr:excinuclease ABC subunit C [Candidatus Hydrogenedentota bacterium]